MISEDPPATISRLDDSPQTAREFLANYWGAQWEKIEPAMIAAKVDLDVPFEFVPWDGAREALASVVLPGKEHLEGQVQGMMKWPADLTTSWLTEYFSLPERLAPTDADLPPIQEIAAPLNDRLEVLSTDWGRGLDFNVRAKWNRGAFVKAPFSTFGVSTETGFYATSAAGHGWAVLLVLTNDDCPDMVALMDEISILREERDRAILEYLKRR